MRLDERVRASSPAVRAGWMARALLHEASASARLDDVFVEAHELLMMDQEAPDGLASQDTQRAYQGLQLLRAVGWRHPNQLLTPRCLLAAARVRLRDRLDVSGYPEWLVSRRAEPGEIREALEKALDPADLAALRRLPPLVGAAGFLVLWHRSGAADLLGGIAGRALAGVWLRREAGGFRTFLPGAGFIGQAAAYRPAAGDPWIGAFLEAAVRAADWGLDQLAALQMAERWLAEAVDLKRTRGHVPALLALLVSSPAISPRGVTETLGIAPMSARRLLDRLQRQHAIREITGPNSFRLFSVL